MNHSKWLGIYIFYDPDGIVDNYVEYMLNAINPFLSDLIFVSNSDIQKDEYSKVIKYTDKIVIRKNIGYDVMAIQHIFLEYYTWNKLYEYSHIVVLNDTFFGPLYPIGNLFKEIEYKSVDLCGLIGRIKNDNNNYTENTFCSFFYVISRRLMMSESWHSFWENMECVKWNFYDVVRQYEYKLIEECEKAGCTWDILYRNDVLRNGRVESNFSDYVNLAYDLIKYYDFPFIKRKPMATELDFSKTSISSLKQALLFIDEETNYDVDMIWQNILRRYNLTSIRKALHLSKTILDESNCSIKTDDLKHCIVLLRINQVELIEEYKEYLNTLENVILIRVFTNNPEVQTQIENATLINNYENLLQLVGEVSKEKRYVLFIDDAGLVEHDIEIITGREVQRTIHNCLWKSKNYICKVIDEFKKNNRLGVGILPFIYYGNYLKYSTDSWEGCFQKIKEMLSTERSVSILDKEIECINYIPAFWVRGSILSKACGFITEEKKKSDTYFKYNFIAKLVPYVAQQDGFYTEDFSDISTQEINCCNYEYLVKKLLKEVDVPINSYRDFKYIGMKSYCKEHKQVYIYGAGVWGRRAYKIIKQMNISNIAGFIVSDNYRMQSELEGMSIFQISEIKLSSEVGILVAVNIEKRDVIINRLKQLEYQEYFLLC